MTLNQSDYVQLNPGVGGEKMATTTDDGVKAQNVHPVYEDGGELFSVSTQNKFPVTCCNHLDFSETLGRDLNSVVEINNTYGFSTIGFHLVVPLGGAAAFEGTFDGINWTGITLREISSDGFKSVVISDEEFIGSISAIAKFRVRTSIAGSVDGNVAGRLTHHVSTIEGIEHGNPPHNLGVSIVRFGLSVTGAVTNQILYTPTLQAPIGYKTLIITGYSFSLSGTGTVTIFDNTNTTNNWVFSGEVKSGTQSVFSNHIFTPPFITSAAGNQIKITTTDTPVIRGVINGYEV